MDPDENLREQLKLSKVLLERDDISLEEIEVTGRRLAELVLALDEWITRGGFLPAPWASRTKSSSSK